MEKQVLKTTITIEFAADESTTAADVLTLVAASRDAGFAKSLGMKPRPEAPATEEPADEAPEQVEEKPKRVRPSRAKAKPAPVEEKPEDTDEATARPPRVEMLKDEGMDEQPDDDEQGGGSNTEATHDDVRELMADVLEEDDANRSKVLKQLQKIGAKSVGQIADEDLGDFYEFLQKLKG